MYPEIENTWGHVNRNCPTPAQQSNEAGVNLKEKTSTSHALLLEQSHSQHWNPANNLHAAIKQLEKNDSLTSSIVGYE